MTIPSRGWRRAVVLAAVAAVALSQPAHAGGLTVVETDPAGDAVQETLQSQVTGEKPANHPVADILDISMGSSGGELVVATTVADIEALEEKATGYSYTVNFDVQDATSSNVTVWLDVDRAPSGEIDPRYRPRGFVTGNNGMVQFPVRAAIDANSNQVVVRAAVADIAAAVAGACQDYCPTFGPGQRLTWIGASAGVLWAEYVDPAPEHVDRVPVAVSSGAQVHDEAREYRGSYVV